MAHQINTSEATYVIKNDSDSFKVSVELSNEKKTFFNFLPDSLRIPFFKGSSQSDQNQLNQDLRTVLMASNQGEEEQKEEEDDLIIDLTEPKPNSLVTFMDCDPQLLEQLSIDSLSSLVCEDYPSINRILKKNNLIIIQFDDLAEIEKLMEAKNEELKEKLGEGMIVQAEYQGHIDFSKQYIEQFRAKKEEGNVKIQEATEEREQREQIEQIEEREEREGYDQEVNESFDKERRQKQQRMNEQETLSKQVHENDPKEFVSQLQLKAQVDEPQQNFGNDLQTKPEEESHENNNITTQTEHNPEQNEENQENNFKSITEYKLSDEECKEKSINSLQSKNSVQIQEQVSQQSLKSQKYLNRYCKMLGLIEICVSLFVLISFGMIMIIDRRIK